MISFIKLGKFQSKVLFDVVSLFTLVSSETIKTIVANRVGDDYTLGGRTSLTVLELMEALDICLQSSFLYSGVIYKEIFNCSMGSPMPPIVVVNMVMEVFEQTTSNTYLKPPSLWVRYVIDVRAIREKTEVEFFHNYLKTVSNKMKFIQVKNRL